MVRTFAYSTPVRTQWIRTPVAGPKPCNTLAFIRCEVPGKQETTGDPDVDRYRMRFDTDFIIDDFKQANHQWYRDNSRVSATASITILNASDDTDFVFAVEAIESDIGSNGCLAFEVQLAMQSSSSGVATTLDVAVSAYVLLYEPRAEPPLPLPPSHSTPKLRLDPMPRFFVKKGRLVFTDDPPQLRKSSG
jgi:hypothetical protein